MKKESKNLGKTIACPWEDCKYTFLAESVGHGELTMKQKCPHCQRPVRFTMLQKTIIILEKIIEENKSNIVAILIIASIIIGASLYSKDTFKYVIQERFDFLNLKE